MSRISSCPLPGGEILTVRWDGAAASGLAEVRLNGLQVSRAELAYLKAARPADMTRYREHLPASARYTVSVTVTAAEARALARGADPRALLLAGLRAPLRVVAKEQA